MRVELRGPATAPTPKKSGDLGDFFGKYCSTFEEVKRETPDAFESLKYGLLHLLGRVHDVAAVQATGSHSSMWMLREYCITHRLALV